MRVETCPNLRALLPGSHYRAFGLNIASTLALPELARVPTSPTSSADLAIEHVVDDKAPGLEAFDQGYSVFDGDGIRFCVAAAGRYDIAGGSRITVYPHSDAAPSDVRLFLLGSAMGAVLHQRRILPLHASAIVHRGGVVAFCAPPGGGKSTLAAALMARGHEGGTR